MSIDYNARAEAEEEEYLRQRERDYIAPMIAELREIVKIYGWMNAQELEEVLEKYRDGIDE